MNFLIVLFFPCFLLASESYKEAKNYAQSLPLPSVSENVLKEIPDFKGASVPETAYAENHQNMGDAATKLTNDEESDVGAILHESQKTRKEFDIRLHPNNPLLTDADKVVSDPLKILKGEDESDMGAVVEVLETEHDCEEAAEPEELSCDRILYFKQKFFTNRRYVDTTVEGSLAWVLHQRYLSKYPEWNQKYQIRTWDKHGKYNFKVVEPDLPEESNSWCSSCGNRNYYAVRKNYETFEDFELIEEWEDTCDSLEEYADQNNCSYGEKTCVEGAETRLIHGRPVFRECWRERKTYHCRVESKNDCGALRAQGCDQTKVDCKRRAKNGTCVEYAKTFTCRSQKFSNGKTKIKGEMPYCLDGNCDEHVWEPNKDFAEAMSKLSIFREMAKDMEASETNATAFKGNAMSCSRATLNFQDCCGSGGWGTSTGLAKACNESEKLLAKERSANKCVFVGTHCSERESVTKICLKKQSGYCCFGSKLSRIFHEQGRKQLGIGWGSSENPNCRAFTLEELQKIDFSKIDLSELFQDIRMQTKAKNVSYAAEKMTQNWSDKVKSVREVIQDKKRGEDVYM